MTYRAFLLRLTFVCAGLLGAIIPAFAQTAILFDERAYTTNPITSNPIFFDGAGNPIMTMKKTLVGDNHGGGAIFTDLNNDGYPDLYLVYGNNKYEPAIDPNTIDTQNQVFLNVAAANNTRVFKLQINTGAEDAGDANGAIAADYDNDGDVDIFVINYNGPNVLLRNTVNPATGSVSFTNEAVNVGVARSFSEGEPLDNSMTAAWADVNRDGFLDLYVGNHNSQFSDQSYTSDPGFGQRDILYMNNGPDANGVWTFSDITTAPWGENNPRPAGSVPVTGYISKEGFDSNTFEGRDPEVNYGSSNAAMFVDFDGDGWMDLWVTNQLGREDMVYRNLGNNSANVWQGFELLTWTDLSLGGLNNDSLGTYDPANPVKDLRGAAMGIDAGDFDNDGDIDICTSDVGVALNDLWINESSDPMITELFKTDLSTGLGGVFSWGVKWADFDNDGWLDLHIATDDLRPGLLFQNPGAGPSVVFTDVSASAMIDQINNSRADVVADYDHDGDLDLLVINLFEVPTFYENISQPPPQATPSSWISVKLIGNTSLPGPNGHTSTTDAIGGRVMVWADLDNDPTTPAEMMTREVRSGAGNSASSSSQRLHFGLGAEMSGAVMRVVFPSGNAGNFQIASGSLNKIVNITETPALPYDVNCTGIVNNLDLNLILDNLGCAWDPDILPPSKMNTPCPGDLNRDGIVDAMDVQIFLNGP